MFTFLPHTADLGVRVLAPDLCTLFAEAGRSLVSLIMENPEAVVPKEERPFALKEKELLYLAHDYLDLLFSWITISRFLPGAFEVSVETREEEGEVWARGRVRGELFQPSRHRFAHEVKAITYHRFSLAQTPEGWELLYYVDL